ncbi:purine-cytosine permease-like protein [Microcella putealis]|uniref:Purine-cytosine permease-like protein n=1 Tax=Microcella putealis TaxID=337005 RepID=A0A4Q7LUI9_9MICO|nr:cytosine permease [Microcella putealis]RZS58796.1 purine-cytosine permease-like protein [Microcella putealis]TQM25015.1 purine-cytosine permease-like protein [Microcella putealis]
MSAPTARASAWRRLDDRLEANADGSGPVKGSLGWGRIAMIWLASNFVVTTMLTGTLFIPGVTYADALLMILVGSIVGGAVLVAVGAMGTRTGLATMSLTRGSFGTRGSLLPVAANLLILLGWSWVQAMLAGITVNYVVAELTGFSNEALFSALCQMIVVGLAIFGHEGISRVEPWLAVVMIGIIGYVLTVAFTTFPPSDYFGIAADVSFELTNLTVLDIVIATAISWTVLSADFNRLGRGTRPTVVGSGVGYVASTFLSMTLGATAIAYVVLSGGEPIGFDPATIVAEFGIALAIVIFVSVMATNTLVVYGMTTSAINAIPQLKLKFLPTALVIGLLTVIGSTFLGLLFLFIDFLFVIGAIFIPVFAIMIVDYYVVNRRVYTAEILQDRGGRYWFTGGVNIANVVVWLLGFGFSLLLTYQVGSPIGATIPAFVFTVVVALAAAAVTGRLKRDGSDPEHAHLADAAPELAERA